MLSFIGACPKSPAVSNMLRCFACQRAHPTNIRLFHGNKFVPIIMTKPRLHTLLLTSVVQTRSYKGLSLQLNRLKGIGNQFIFSETNSCVRVPKSIVARRMATDPSQTRSNQTGLIYICAIGVFMIGMTYAGVPLYRMFCQATGQGQATQEHDTSKVETMLPVKERVIKVKFNADIASSMQWNFRPQQAEVNVLPGETALAFYRAKNPTDKPIIGISTYNVVPFEAGQYFNKIQCFCFEEQRLNPHEEVDMPVFFYIDPDFADDPKLETIDQITLSYTFFEAKEGMSLPLPGYMQPAHQ